MREAQAECAEYFFLFPLFVSVTLLTKTGFFVAIADGIAGGLARIGSGHMAWLQFVAATFVSAILNNNIVADFGSRALIPMDDTALRLFAVAQIAGYALGGCWTHIGSAQSVVAYSFIQRDIDSGYTPVEWIRLITPVILEMGVVITAILYLQSAWLR